MAVSKVILNGNTLMDTTQKTVTAASMLNGITALKNDGTDITGSIASKTSSDLTASGDTITAPAGYYASSASKAVTSGTAGTPTATKGTVSSNSVSVTPSVTNTTGYITGGTKTGTPVTVSASELVSGTKTISASGTTDVTNYASASVASGSATTPATTITANPSISVSSGGLITASVSASQSVTPTVSAGYVSSGTAGTVSVSGSNTSQLTTQAAQTITPTTTNQTIASGKYLTGVQTIEGIVCTNLTAENIAEGVTVKIGTATDDDSVASVTGTHSGGGGNYTVTVSLTNPISPGDFMYCDIYEATTTDMDDAMNGPIIATISSATGSTSVTISSSSYGIIIDPEGDYGASYSWRNMTFTNKIYYNREAFSRIFPYASLFLVGSDGTITIDGIDYGD